MAWMNDLDSNGTHVCACIQIYRVDGWIVIHGRDSIILPILESDQTLTLIRYARGQ